MADFVKGLRRRRTSTGAELVSSGLLVPAYYQAQAREDFETEVAAADHYLDEGWSRGLLPNPVHDFTGRDLPGRDSIESSDGLSMLADLPVRTYVDLAAYERIVPGASSHVGGPALHLLETIAGSEIDFLMTERDGRSFSWSELMDVSKARSRSLARIIASGVFDQELYEAQAGRTFASDGAAVWHYLEVGEAAGWSPHVAFSPRLDPARSDNPRSSPFARAIAKGRLEAGLPQTQDRRTTVLELARRGREAIELGRSADAAIPRGFGEIASGPTRHSDQTVTIVVDASALEGMSDRHVLTVVAQTHTAWEMLVAVEPGIRGRRSGYVKRLIAVDARIRTIETSELPIQVDTLMRAADGDVVAFWDGREHWAPRFLELGLPALDDHGVVAAAVAEGASFDQLDQHGHIDLDVGALERLTWSGPRSLRGVLAQRGVMGPGLAVPHGLLAQWEWLLHLRQQGEIGFLPMLGVVGPPPVDVDPGAVAQVRARWLPLERRTRSAGSTAALMPVVDDVDGAITTMELVMEAGLDVVAVVSDPRDAVEIGSVLTDVSRLTVVFLPDRTTWGHAASIAVTATTAETSVFVSAGTRFRPEQIVLLTESLSAGVVAVCPLVISTDSTIRSAGLVFPGRRHLPYRLIHGHPAEDARLPGGTEFFAAEGEGLTMRTAMLDELGFSPRLDEAWAAPELTSRAADTGPTIRTVTDVRFELGRAEPVLLTPGTAPEGIRRTAAAPDVNRVLASVGMELRGVRTDADRRTVPTLIRPVRLVSGGPADGLPALRWALKVPMKSNTRGDSAGDVFFANDLAAALRRLGQEVVQDRRDSHHRLTSSHLDDVVLGLRGLIPYQAQPEVTSALWIISHPDEIGPGEVDAGSVDLVYAASHVWAEMASRRFGREVRPLLQATDPTRFHPGVPSVPHSILFVGRPRGETGRPIVRDALLAGQQLDVYGPRWSTFIDAEHIRADFLPNDDLPAAYAGARIVLNDHHEDMAANGFWSNRVFDAISSGALVVSDEVAGGPDMFGGLVRTYSCVDELRLLLDSDAEGWPDHESRLLLADRVRRQHSFDVRARTLLGDVLAVRNVDHDLASGEY